MAEQILKEYKSRRNRAVLVQTDAGTAVIKTFATEEAFRKEWQVYRSLQHTLIPCARVIRAEQNTLVLTRLPGETLTDHLQKQEQMACPAWEVWDALVDWLVTFTRHTNLVMTDVNLRNFLYDGQTKVLYGLDFEQCDPGSILITAAKVAAFIRTYQPEHTDLKMEISSYVLQRFARCCGLEREALEAESLRQEAMLLERRNNRI